MTATMGEPIGADVTRARRDLEAHISANRARVTAIAAERAAARRAGDAGAVLQLDVEAEDLTAEITALEDQLKVARGREHEVRERERLADLTREVALAGELVTATADALRPAVAALARGWGEFATAVWRLAELRESLDGRPTASTVDEMRGPEAQFLEFAVGRLFAWAWLRQYPHLHQRPATGNLTGPQGEAEKIVYAALYPNG